MRPTKVMVRVRYYEPSKGCYATLDIPLTRAPVPGECVFHKGMRYKVNTVGHQDLDEHDPIDAYCSGEKWSKIDPEDTTAEG
jgi:hypothetical protein